MDATATTEDLSILIADDDPAYRELLAEIASHVGLRVQQCKDGNEVMQQILSSHPDIILLDVAMPGFDGISVCRHIRTNRPDLRLVPIVIVTAFQDTKTRVQALEAGADQFIMKPVKTSELMSALRELLEIKQLGEALDSDDLAERLSTVLTSRS